MLLQSPGNGILEDLSWQLLNHPQPGPGEVTIEVRAAGLNLRDLMNALAMRSDHEALGGECSGVILAVGTGVERFKVGDAVLGMARGSFGSAAVAESRFIVPKPVELSFAESAALPIASLRHITACTKSPVLGKEQKVLIHAAAGCRIGGSTDCNAGRAKSLLPQAAK
jgi:NADPH:quinone reductase-like Zn-dependent oxidoreductase